VLYREAKNKWKKDCEKGAAPYLAGRTRRAGGEGALKGKNLARGGGERGRPKSIALTLEKFSRREVFGEREGG